MPNLYQGKGEWSLDTTGVGPSARVTDLRPTGRDFLTTMATGAGLTVNVEASPDGQVWSIVATLDVDTPLQGSRNLYLPDTYRIRPNVTAVSGASQFFAA